MSGEADISSIVLAGSSDLQFVRQGRAEQSRYVVSDIRRGKHVSLTPEAYRLLGEFDGRRSLAQIYTASGSHLPPPDGVVKTVLQLHAAGLVIAVEGKLPERGGAGIPPYEASLVSWRRELFDLAGLLPVLDRLFGGVFSRAGFIVWSLLLIAAMLAVTSDRAPDIDPAGWLSQLDPARAAMLYLLFLALKALHEIGHAVAYRRFAAQEGVRVGSVRAGVAFMFLMPFPFTNVTGAWRLASRWRRAAIGAAGMYIESWPALIGTIVWALSPDPLTSSVAGHVAAIAGVTTILFNLNPLGRMDGYYIFADLADRPNLARQGSQAALNVLARLARAVEPERLGPVDGNMFAYWAGALLFRVSIYVGIFWAALRHGMTLAIAVLLIASSLLAVRPLIASVRWLLNVSEDKPATRRKLIGVAVAAGLLLLVPLPSTVALSGIVENAGLVPIYPPRAARVVEADGKAAFDTIPARLELAELDARRGLAVARWQQALTQGDPRSRDFSEEASALAARATALRDDIRVLETGLGTAGVVSLDLADHLSSWVPAAGRPIAVGVRPGSVAIRAVGSERERDRIAAATRGTARPLGRPEQQFAIDIIDVAPETAESLPSAALGRPAGGSVAVDPNDSAGRRAAEPMVAVLLRARDKMPALRQGQRVEVRLRGPLRPLGVQAADRLAGFLGAPPVG